MFFELFGGALVIPRSRHKPELFSAWRGSLKIVVAPVLVIGISSGDEFGFVAGKDLGEVCG